MLEDIPAVYRDGAFYPVTPCDLANESRVILHVEEPRAGTDVVSVEQRRQALKRAVEIMRSNPLPLDAPPITREWIYERS